jgi:hypothetical protein
MAPDVLLTGQHVQLLERTLSELDLRPDANLQKVERSHRTDEEEFYRRMAFPELIEHER